jgi:putative membrane protein
MDRRVLLTGMGAMIGAPLFIRTAFAQDMAPAGSVQPMPGETLDADQAKHMQQTMMCGSLSLLASRMAVKKAKNAKVLEFAKFEVAEQETVADILNGMMKSPSDASGKVVAPSDEEAMSHVDADGKDTLNKLKGLSGAQFDDAFVKAQVDTHKKLLSIQESYLDSGKNREELSVAKLAKGMIDEHLKLLNDIEKMRKI